MRTPPWCDRGVTGDATNSYFHVTRAIFTVPSTDLVVLKQYLIVNDSEFNYLPVGHLIT